MRPDGVSIEVTDAPPNDDIALIEGELVAFNEARAIPYDRRPLAVLAKAEDGRTLGGATGYTNWGWLYLDCFWLPETLRGGGLGTAMIRAAEVGALARGCHHARLYSYSFQAPGFYERLGYVRFGVLDDYPPGHAQIWMQKAL